MQCRSSLCENGIDWFKSHGKWQETGGIPSAGSLVFFDWNGDGISDHVGIVEKYEGGIIYTVEGNTGTNIGGNNVRGVWKHFIFCWKCNYSWIWDYLNKENKKCYFIQALNKHNKRKQADLWSIIFHKSVVKVVFL